MYTVNAWLSTLSETTKVRGNLVILQALYFKFRHFQYTKTLAASNEKIHEMKDLAKKENELYSLVIEIYKENLDKETDERLGAIFKAYLDLFDEYLKFAKTNDEALKRALFIHWYSISEPNYLSGIPELHLQRERNILQLLESRIANSSLDAELNWMLNYYGTWDYIYNRFPELTELNKLIRNRSNKNFPTKINKDEMQKRGQMGKYWNSLNKFASR